ncbi:hypothetical protein [Bradyrhizobium yuanmingense]|uniref:hypothetical protein n=1 Tax=Bradyrhizobium yuanmingense TaxID=108015 RepID=UPI0012E39C54|nr:hypothetical protein [Bradyrhizobium yuanmingense]
MISQRKDPEFDFGDESIASSLKQDIIDSIRLYFSPFIAIADDFRNSARISERAIVIPALKAAARKPDGYISTSELILELENALRPTGEDAEILKNRADTRFSQIVRNLKSHRQSATSMFARGLAIEERDGLRITPKGRAFLQELPDS